MIHCKLGRRAIGPRVLAVCFVTLAHVSGFAQDSSSHLGLEVNSQGVLTRHGVPYRGIGVNYYDAFLRVLRNPQDTSYEQGFAALGKAGIPFARINAGSFVASDVRFYVEHREEFLRRLDGVVRAAEAAHVGLFPSLFWEANAVAAAVNESPASWRDAHSSTRQLMRQYTQDVVTRYLNSPAIWGWEFSCEVSLAVDTRARKGDANHFDYDMFRAAALDFAHVVRQFDPHRLLLTGNSLPRINAYHNSTFAPNGPDTEAQFGRILLRDNPGPFNPICIHASPANIGRYFGDRPVNFEQLLTTSMAIGRRAGKAVYLEEFIPTPKDASAVATTNERDYFTRELAAIENSNVPIASVWLYDRKLSNNQRYNLTFANDRSYMLQMIADFDRSVHAQQ